MKTIRTFAEEMRERRAARYSRKDPEIITTKAEDFILNLKPSNDRQLSEAEQRAEKEKLHCKVFDVPDKYINAGFRNFETYTEGLKSKLEVCKQFAAGELEKPCLYLGGMFGNGKTHLGIAVLRNLPPVVSAAGTSAFLDAAANAGSVYNATKDSGKASSTFWSNLALGFVTDKLGVFSDDLEGFKKALVSAPAEGVQEFYQSLIEQHHTNGYIDIEQALHEAGIGAMVGGFTGYLMPKVGGDEQQRQKGSLNYQKPTAETKPLEWNSATAKADNYARGQLNPEIAVDKNIVFNPQKPEVPTKAPAAAPVNETQKPEISTSDQINELENEAKNSVNLEQQPDLSNNDQINTGNNFDLIEQAKQQQRDEAQYKKVNAQLNRIRKKFNKAKKNKFVFKESLAVIDDIRDSGQMQKAQQLFDEIVKHNDFINKVSNPKRAGQERIGNTHLEQQLGDWRFRNQPDRSTEAGLNQRQQDHQAGQPGELNRTASDMQLESMIDKYDLAKNATEAPQRTNSGKGDILPTNEQDNATGEQREVYRGYKFLDDYSKNKVDENRNIISKIFEYRQFRKEQGKDQKTLKEIGQLVNVLRTSGLDAKYENDILKIGKTPLYPHTVVKQNTVNQIYEQAQKPPEAAKPYAELNQDEISKQTIIAQLIDSSEMPDGFGEKTFSKGVKDIVEDGGKEQSKEAQIIRSYINDIKADIDQRGYYTLPSGETISRDEIDYMIDEHAETDAKHNAGVTDANEDTSFNFGANNEQSKGGDTETSNGGFIDEIGEKRGRSIEDRAAEKKPTIEKTASGDQYTLGGEMKPQMPTKAKFEGKEDKSEETPLFEQQQEDEDQELLFQRKENDDLNEMLFKKFEESEDKPELITLHNLSGDNLLHSDELGGLPVPSLAVTKPGNEFTGFGEITLIGNKRMINPEEHGNKTFGADAYSPTVPKAEYNVDKKAKNKLVRKFEKAQAKWEDWDEYDRKIAAGKDSFVNDAIRTRTGKALFLEAMGEDISPLQKNVEYESDLAQGNEAIIQKFEDSGLMKDELRYDDHEYLRDLADLYKELVEAKIKRDYGDMPKETQTRRKERYLDDIGESGMLHYSPADKLQRTFALIKNPRMEFDRHGTDKMLKEKFDKYGEEKFRKWIEPQLDEVYQDKYFKRGSKKVPYTLSNLVDAMTGKTRGQEQGMTFSLGKARSMGSKQFKTFKQLKEAAQKIVGTKEFDATKKQLDDEFFNLANKLESYYPYSDRWNMLDDLSKSIGEYGAGRKSLSAALRGNDFHNLNSHIVEEIGDFAEKLFNSPTVYFESKPQRAVKISEFEGAIVPEDTSKEVLEVLKKHGIERIEFYNNYNDPVKSRIAAVSKFDDLLFKKKQSAGSSENPTFDQMSAAEQEEFLSEIEKGLGEEWHQRQEDLSQHGAKGVTRVISKIVGFDPKTADITTAWHESLHAAVTGLMDERQAKALLRAFGWDGKGEITSIKGNKSLENAHEKLADKYVEWRQNKYKARGKLLKLFTQIKELFEKISNAYKGKGFISESEIFRKLANGDLKAEAAKRNNKATATEPEPVLAQKSIPSVRGDEFGTGSLKEMRIKAKEFLSSLRDTKYKNNDLGKHINLRQRGIKESLSNSYNIEKLKAISVLPELLKTSIYIGSEENIRRGQKAVIPYKNHFVSPIEIGGDKYLVRIVVDEFKDGSLGLSYYDHLIADIKKSDKFSGEAPNTESGQTTNLTDLRKKYKEFFSNVKDNFAELDRLEEVRNSNNLLQKAKDLKGTFDPDDNILFQIIGEKGAAALDEISDNQKISDNLKVAREMEAEGKDARTIRAATGWENSKDGWKYEISDITAKKGVDKAVFAKAVEARRKITELNKLEDYQSDRIDLIKSVDDLVASLGQNKFNKAFNLALSEALKKNDPSLLPDNSIANLITARSAMSNEGTAKLGDVLDGEVFKAYPELRDVSIEFDDIGAQAYFSKSENKITVDNSRKLNEERLRENIIHELQHAAQFKEGFAKGGSIELMAKMRQELLNAVAMYNDIMSEAHKNGDKELYEKAKKAKLERVYKYGKISDSPALAYHDLAGEVEARNAAKRANIPIEERKGLLLEDTADVHEDSKIYLDHQENVYSEKYTPEAENEPEDKFKRHRESTLIKKKLQHIEQGKRLGARETTKQLEAIKKQIVKYAKENLPKDEMTRGQITPLMTQIAEAKNIGDIEKAYKKIEQIDLTVRRKKTVKKIKEMIKKAPLKPDNRKMLKSGLALEYSRVVKKLKEIQKLGEEEALKMVEDIELAAQKESRDLTEDEKLEIYLLGNFGSMSSKKVEQLEALQAELDRFLTEGRLNFRADQEFYKLEMDELRSKAELAITGGEGAQRQEVERERGLGKKKLFDSLSGFDSKQQSFEWLLDKIQKLDTESGVLEGVLNKHFSEKIHRSLNAENIGTRKQFNKITKKLEEIYGLKGKKLENRLNENKEEIENTGVTYRGYNGKRIELKNFTTNELYKRWLELQDPTLKQTFFEHGYDDQTFEELEKALPDDVKQFAKWQLEEFYPSYYEEVNKVYQRVFNIDLPYNPFYTPISRKGDKFTVTDDELLRNKSFMASVMNGHLMVRTKNSQEIDFADGDTVLMRHITQMQHFIAWAETARDLRSVFGNEQIRKAIRQYHGGEILKVLDKQINDIVRGGIDRAAVVRTADKLRSNFVKAKVGGNLVVTAKQLASIPAFAMDIPIKDFAEGIKDFTLNPIKTSKFLWNNSEYLKSRYEQGFDRDIILGMRKAESKRLAKGNSIQNLIMLNSRLGDAGAILAGGYGVYKYHYKKAIAEGKSEAEAVKHGIEQFEMAARRTQQSGEIADLSDLQRGGSWNKLFTMFITSQNQYYRQVSAASRNLKHGRGSKLENIKKIAIAHFVLPSLFQYIASGFPGLFSDWDEEDAKRMLRANVVGSFNGLLIAGDIAEYVIDSILSLSYGGYQALPVYQTVDDGEKAIKEVIKAAEKGKFGFDEILIVADELMSTAGSLKGIPYDPIKRNIEGAYKAATDKKAPAIQALGYSDSALGGNKKKSRRASSRSNSKRNNRRN